MTGMDGRALALIRLDRLEALLKDVLAIDKIIRK